MAARQHAGQRQPRRRPQDARKQTTEESCICGHEKKHHNFYGIDLCRKCACAAFVPVTQQGEPEDGTRS